MYAKCLNLTAAIAFFRLFAIGSAWAQIPKGCPAPVPESLDSSQPPNLGLIKAQLLYYRCTKYDSEVEKKLTEARGWIEMRAPQVSKPAIVFDIDETALSNWTSIKRNDFAYFRDGPCDPANKRVACGQIAWDKLEQATALAPTHDLFNFAKCKDLPRRANCTSVAVFLSPDASTRKRIILKKIYATKVITTGMGLYMRDPSTDGQPVAIPKTAARNDIESRLGYT
jgi:acid phosphatase